MVEAELLEGSKHKIHLVINLLLVYQPFLYLFPFFELGMETFMNDFVYTVILLVMQGDLVLSFKELSKDCFRKYLSPFFPERR